MAFLMANFVIKNAMFNWDENNRNRPKQEG